MLKRSVPLLETKCFATWNKQIRYLKSTDTQRKTNNFAS